MDRVRKARERGDILQMLKEDYTTPMTGVNVLRRALDSLNTCLSPDDLDFHLVYLFDQEYVRIWRRKDLPGFRRDRAQDADADQILFVRLTARGLQLVDGEIKEDQKVAFS